MSKKLNKICVICSDKASGFNFNAITCESCKAFFRRNASKAKSLRCFLGGNCSIDVTNRKYCKKCRLDKCFSMGMLTVKPELLFHCLMSDIQELILTEKQKEIRQNKINENKKLKLMDELNKIADSDQKQHDERILSKEYFEMSFDINLNSIESTSQVLVADEVHDSIYRDAVELEFSVLPFIRPEGRDRSFNDLESNRFRMLTNAMRAFDVISPQNIEEINDFYEAIRMIVIKSDFEIRNTIKMCKLLDAFRSISERDQLILLKYASIEILCLRVVVHFDFQTFEWTAITDSPTAYKINLDLLRAGKRNYYVDLKIFYTKIWPQWDCDINIINLLTAIILFDPKRPKLSQIEPIKFQQQIYMYLLQRYLQNKYESESESVTKFLRLLNSLNELHIVNDKLSLNWSEADPKKVLPLLQEVSNRNDF